MWNHVRKAVGLTAFCFGLATTSAGAAESRVAAFLFPCDGKTKIVTFTAQNVSTKELLSLANGENRSNAQFTGFIPVSTDATGNVSFSISGSCLPGAGQVQGVATVWFF